MFVYLGNFSKTALRSDWEDCAVQDSESYFEMGHQEWSKSDCYKGSAQIHSAMQTIHLEWRAIDWHESICAPIADTVQFVVVFGEAHYSKSSTPLLFGHQVVREEKKGMGCDE